MHVLRPIAGLAAAWLFTVAAAQPLILRPEPGQVVHSNAGQVVVVVTGVPRGAHVVPVLDGRCEFTLENLPQPPVFRSWQMW